MPDSKSILNDAKKDLDFSKSLADTIEGMCKQVQGDAQAVHKGLVTARAGIATLKANQKDWEKRIRDLNAGLSTLQKNEPVMKAPADAGTYKKLVNEYTRAIADSMAAMKKCDETIKFCDRLVN